MSRPAAFAHRTTGHAVESLRVALRERFGAVADAPTRRAPTGDPIPSGWTRVDRALGGGLRPGQSAVIEGSVGAGSLALTSSWARETARRGEAVLVLDAAGSTLPHAWVEPEDARAPIWVLALQDEHQVWPALDIGLRSRAFGLVAVLDPPSAPPGVGPRARRLLGASAARALLTQGPGRAAPWTPSHRLRLEAGLLRWVEGPTGAAPEHRDVEVRCSDGRSTTPRPVEREAADSDGQGPLRIEEPDRLRPAPRAPDRRAPSGRGGRVRRSGRG